MTISRVLLALILLAGVLVMAADHRALNDAAVASEELRFDHPERLIGNTYTLPSAARRAGQQWSADPDGAVALISKSLQAYPLNTRGWLDLARIEASRHGQFSDTLDANLQAAVGVRPKSRSTRWQAAQIALHAGDTALAEHHLYEWLKGEPGDTQRALFIARRWIDDADDLVERMVPADEVFLSRAMDFAFQQRDFELARAIWLRVEDRVDLADPIFLTYVDFLFGQGFYEQAVELWDRYDPHYRPGSVANGDFSRPLGDAQGLNWRIGRLPSGVRMIRDEDEFQFRPASLRIEFSGDHNLRLRAPWIRIPVTPGTRYQLSGYWKADGLTTRALPFWYVEGEGGRINQRVDVPDSRFDWTPWSVTFDVPETSRMIRLRLRRDSTSAFDRYIDGQLWLDGIELTEVPLNIDDPAIGDAPDV